MSSKVSIFQVWSTPQKLMLLVIFVFCLMVLVDCELVVQLCLTLLPHGLQPARLLCPWDFPATNTGVSCYFLFQGSFLTQELNPGLLHHRQTIYYWSHREVGPHKIPVCYVRPLKQSTFQSLNYVSLHETPGKPLLLLLLGRFSRVRLCVTPQMAGHQSLSSLGSSRQEHWSGLPFPSPMREVKSESEVSQSCPTLCDPMDYSLPGSSVHRIFQARVLEWLAIASSDGKPLTYL